MALRPNIEVACPDCGAKRIRRTGWASLLCRSCAQKGEGSASFRHRLSGAKEYQTQAMRRLGSQWRGTERHSKIKIQQVEAKRKKLEAIAGRPCPDNCEICSKPAPKRYSRLYFDHDHKTGKFR